MLRYFTLLSVLILNSIISFRLRYNSLLKMTMRKVRGFIVKSIRRLSCPRRNSVSPKRRLLILYWLGLSPLGNPFLTPKKRLNIIGLPWLLTIDYHIMRNFIQISVKNCKHTPGIPSQVSYMYRVVQLMCYNS